MNRKLLVVGAVVLGVLVGGIVVTMGNGLGQIEDSLVSPMGKKTGWLGMGGESGSGYEIVAFLPPWLISKAELLTSEIDQLIFLGVEADTKGNLIWDGQSNKIKQREYLEMKEQIRKWNKKNILGIKLFDDKKLDMLMVNANSRANLVSQIKEQVVLGRYDGVNIDFEYQADPVAILGEQFGIFMDELRAAKVGELGVDVFANTIIKGEGAKIKKLAGKVDWIIVMAYDFHRPGVDFAGPVAPIKSGPGERSLTEVVDRVIADEIERKKIIMAYPLYGYEWKTYGEELGAQVIRGWYSTASLGRVNELLKNTADAKALAVKWDELSQTPWLIFKEPETKTVTKRVGKRLVKNTVTEDVIHQIYYDDVRSLGMKYKLVTDNQLGGIGYWALGYEGDGGEVWKGLEEALK